MKTCCYIICPVSCWVTCVDTSGHVAWSSRHQETTERVITSECCQVPGSPACHRGIIISSGAQCRMVSSSSDRLESSSQAQKPLFTVYNVSLLTSMDPELESITQPLATGSCGCLMLSRLDLAGPGPPLSGKIVQFSHGSPHLPPARCLAPNW